MLKCCGSIIRPKRFSFTDDSGLKIVKVGFCNNPKCGIPVIELESISIFGRVQKEIFRGKRARKFLEENRVKFLEHRRYRQYKENTAKGFHYSNSYWDLKENKLKVEYRELATNRLVKREVLELKEKKLG